MKKVVSFINENKLLTTGDSLLIGVSGGADSMALLRFFISIRQEYSLILRVAHLNHCMRGESSNRDEQFVKSVCKKYGIQCFTKRINVHEVSVVTKTSIEEAGRNERYVFFNGLCRRYQIDKICLAHHKNDQIETIFMRIVRGTGIKGLRGMIPIRDNIVRPFLCISKKEILTYCDQYSVDYIQDESNEDIRYQRNRFRIEILPLMRHLNNNFSENMIHLGTISHEYYDYISKEVDRIWPSIVNENRLSIRKFQKTHIAIQREIILKMFGKEQSDNISFNHIEIILDKVNNDFNTTWSIHMPNDIEVVRSYDFLMVQKRCIQEDLEYSYDILINKTYVLPRIDIIVETKIIKNNKDVDFNKNNLVGYFDYDKIRMLQNSLVLRNRLKGDRISPLGMEGSKKIKDIFIEKKIPLNIRSKIPILAVKDEILWVLGYHKSKKFIADEHTKKILVLSFKDNEEDMLRATGYRENTDR